MAQAVMLGQHMPDFLKIVIEEMARRDWTAYRLIQELKGKREDGRDVPAMTVRGFLRGTTPLNSRDLGLIFDVLEIPVGRRPVKGRKGKR